MATSHMNQTLELPHKAYLLPEAIPMWPPAWWTWLVLLAFILFLGLMVFGLLRRHQKRGYRREALTKLNQAQMSLSNRDTIVLCHELIRRCLITENKMDLASQPAPKLIEHLDQQLKEGKRFADLDPSFIDGPYRPHLELSQAQRNAIIQTTQDWIRKHHA